MNDQAYFSNPALMQLLEAEKNLASMKSDSIH